MFNKLVLLLAAISKLSSATDISQPSFDLSNSGDSFGLLGSYSGISLYKQTGASSFLNSTKSTESKLYVRDPSNNDIQTFAQFDGTADSIYTLPDGSVLITGNYTKANNNSVISPIIYNISSGELTQIFDNDIDGSVKSILLDKELIYLGGDFTFNNTHGVAVYNISSKQVNSLPFKGFGENSSVNTMMKILDNDDDNTDKGSIVFGGSFNNLGLGQLLIHNYTDTKHNQSNTTNTSIITAEQIISLKHGIFTQVNSNLSSSSLSSLTCPFSSDGWSPIDNSGGEWKVELADGMKGLTPTKARLYLPTSGDDQIEIFRIYSYPNNGIMNLSYVDPNTNEIAYCDAWCPLIRQSKLQNITEYNADNVDEIAYDDTVFVDSNDGSFSMYYDESTKTKTLGYGSDYVEFGFENSVVIDGVGLTVISWYGSKGSINGFELYSNSIQVYGNETLNEANCGDDSDTENSSTTEGNWVSVNDIDGLNIANTNYLVSQIQSGDSASVTLYPNISYSGNYSLLLSTPGCIQDNSCLKRSIVNVTVYDVEENILSSQEIYQNNNYDKFDYLYYGHLNGTTESNNRNRIEVQFVKPVIENTQESWMVMDKITADIVSLDEYFGKNSTNHNSTKSSSNITEMRLNGLFEYSLANFSDFNENLVYNKTGNKTVILSTNNFVGNSSINYLSSKLSSGANINTLASNSGNLLISGDFEVEAKNFNDNLIQLPISVYNDTSNETEVATKIEKRYTAFANLDDADFNSQISSIVKVNDGIIVLGNFVMNGTDILNLADNNKTVSSANNYAAYLSNKWYSFGNEFINTTFNQFTNITIDNIEYYVFSSATNVSIWDNTNSKIVTDKLDNSLDIKQAAMIGSKQVVLGSGFNVMDEYIISQSKVSNNNTINGYDFNVTEGGIIDRSYYINSSLGVISGKFNTSQNITDIGFLNNGTLSSLSSDFILTANASFQSFFASDDDKYLFIGLNGTVQVDNSNHSSGVVIYDLQNNSITDFQPAQLIASTGNVLEINSIALHDTDSKLLVGGSFVSAGSLDCAGMCIYDITNTRWIQPSTNSSISGTVKDMKFITSDIALLAGNLTVGDETGPFVSYDFGASTFSSVPSLNTLGAPVQGFTKLDKNGETGGRYIAYGAGFVSGYDGSKWVRIDSDIDYNDPSDFTDIKILNLASANKSNNETYFDETQILMLSGSFSLKEYGRVNVALFNGTNWVPYVFTVDGQSSLGSIKSIFVKDIYAFKSSKELKTLSNVMSRGKVVGISLACAIGATAVLSLLYLIPYLFFFRTSKDEVPSQRVHEDEMMGTIDPEDLLHEIDFQRR